MKIVGTAEELLEVINSCLETWCEECLFRARGICGIYRNNGIASELRDLDPGTEKHIEI